MRARTKLRIGYTDAEVPQQQTSLFHSLRPSVVYDSYWRFAAERHSIFFKRIAGDPPPWTCEPVLREYKFTNAYRASDRVSQYLIGRVIYREDLSAAPDEVFFRIMLFKLFNKIETRETLERAFGALALEDYSFPRYDKVFTKAMECGKAIYSAAYIMPSGGATLGHDRKHRNHLALLERMITESLTERLTEASSMQKAFGLLRSYPTIGDFLAYQYIPTQMAAKRLNRAIPESADPRCSTATSL